MSSHRQETVRRLAAPDIAVRKGGVPIVCLTAYTAPMAELLDDHCDLLLVGDSLGRSEERRVGKECRRLCRSRWSPYH
jgi:3-methyl-2-oxobutanoate hydroxymethyltransferase